MDEPGNGIGMRNRVQENRQQGVRYRIRQLSYRYQPVIAVLVLLLLLTNVYLVWEVRSAHNTVDDMEEHVTDLDQNVKDLGEEVDRMEDRIELLQEGIDADTSTPTS